MLPTKTNRNPTPDPNRKYETPNPRESRFAANAEEKATKVMKVVEWEQFVSMGSTDTD